MKTQFQMKASNLPSILVVLLILPHASKGKDYYCDRGHSDPTPIANQTSGTITTLYEGQSHYPDNMLCQWVLDAGEGRRIQLTVIRSQLQWAPESAICMGGYDYMAVHQGQTQEAKEKVQWCGERNPESIVSFGRYLYIRFETNANNPYSYSGIKLNFKVFDENTCPPGWLEDGEKCLYLSNQQKNWGAAQRQCNYKWANLAIIHSEATLNLMAQEAGRRQVTEAWIGLHDKATEGDFRWIDGSRPSFSRLAEAQDENSFDFDCVMSRFSPGEVTWLAQDCSLTTHVFFCEMPKSGPTELYAIPASSADGNPDASSNTVALILGVAFGILGFIIVLIIILALCIKARKKKKARLPRRRSHFEGGAPGIPPSPEDYRRQVVGQESEPSVRFMDVNSSAVRNDGGERRSTVRPSAPVQETEGEARAPPPYEEALTHPVIKIY